MQIMPNRSWLPTTEQDQIQQGRTHSQTLQHDQYVIHAHSYITRVAAAMDSCFVLIRTH